MIIEELKLTLFKGFRDFTLKCSPFTCLVGLNSRGKTSILQAVRLLHDILVFAFGNKDRPNFGNPQWQSNPSHGLTRLSFGDPDALWLHKKTSEPCKIAVKYSGNIDLRLEIAGRDRYRLDIEANGKSIITAINESANQRIIEQLFFFQPAYVPSVDAVSPSEDLLWQPQMMQKVDMGRDSECWRSRLYWLWNDGDRVAFDDLVALVQQYLPEARILPPRLTHDQPSRVLVEYQEEDTIFDISTSGGGLRTLLNLAAVLQFSQAKCILCDEPDSHLHGSLQRAVARMLYDFALENDRQVFAATHAPDFIAEVPVESIVWIDRTQGEARCCSDVGRVLADLGAVSKADAVRACGADKVLFVEGSLDRPALARLIALAGATNPFSDSAVLIASFPSGKGDAVHLRMFRDLLREVFKLNVAVACITDNDYELRGTGGGEETVTEGPLLLSLGRKEVENYLIEPDLLNRAVAAAAEQRRARIGTKVTVPSLDTTKSKLADILNDAAIRDLVRWQLVPRYRESLDPGLDKSTREAHAEQWFRERWEDEQWRMRNCPGKSVLKKVRDWSQNEFGLTLTAKFLVNALTECPSDIADIAQKLQAYFYGNTVGA